MSPRADLWKRSLAVGLAALALLAIVGFTAHASTSAAAARCTSSFTVLHNDRVGALSIPTGNYYLTPGGLSCGTASELVTRFLDDFDGALPGGWTVNAASSSFVNAAQNQSISLGTRLPPRPSSGGRCPGTFTVEHNDRIGALLLRAGRYTVTTRRLSCSVASSRLAFFLFHDSAGTLPRPWKLNLAARRFSRGSSSFSVKFAGRRGKSGGGGVHPNLAITCPGTVSLAAPATLGSLIIPAGSYYVNVFTNLPCSAATRLFKQFVTAGGLPPQWTLDADTGTFLRGKEGFQIESTA